MEPATLWHLLRKAPSLMLLAALLSQAAQAEAGCTEPSSECVETGQWDISLSLGAGTRTNPIRGNSNIPMVALPHVSYYGERFFLENLELGVTLHESESQTFNLVAAPGYDRVFFFKNDLQNIFVDGLIVNGVPRYGVTVDTDEGAVTVQLPANVPVRSRRTTYLAGPEWSFTSGRLTGQLAALYEMTGRHHGTEVRAAVAAPIPVKGELVASAGLTWKSTEVVRYYYGIENIYEPGPALNPFIKLSYALPLSERWTFSAFAHYEYLDKAVSNSPTVSEPDVTTVFAGFVWKVL